MIWLSELQRSPKSQKVQILCTYSWTSLWVNCSRRALTKAKALSLSSLFEPPSTPTWVHMHSSVLYQNANDPSHGCSPCLKSINASVFIEYSIFIQIILKFAGPQSEKDQTDGPSMSTSKTMLKNSFWGSFILQNDRIILIFVWIYFWMFLPTQDFTFPLTAFIGQQRGIPKSGISPQYTTHTVSLCLYSAQSSLQF